MAVAIAGEEIHVAVHPSRIKEQRLLDLAGRLDKLAPVQRAQQAQAIDSMTDGDLVRGLILALDLDQLLDGKSLVREPLLKPGPRQVHRRALAGQALGELRHEGTSQWNGEIGRAHV